MVAQVVIEINVYLLFNGELDINERDVLLCPTDGVSILLWWWGLSAPETLRAMPAVA
jgi:hypothetical protein